MSVKIIDHADKFRDLVPGAEVRPNVYGGLQVGWSMHVVLDIENAVDAEHAAHVLHSLAGQVQAHASRELGIDPLMEGLRAENRALMEANRQLGTSLATARKRIAVLEEQRDDLTSRIYVLQEERSQ